MEVIAAWTHSEIRCRFRSSAWRRLDFVTVAKQFQTRHSERSEESRKNIVLIMRTFVLLSCQRQGRGGIQRGRVTWSDLATSGNLPRCVATRGKRFEVSFRKKAGGQLENFATLKQSPNRHITPTQITIVQPDGWLLGCGECNQLPTKKTQFSKKCFSIIDFIQK